MLEHRCANCSSTFTHEPTLKCCSFSCASKLRNRQKGETSFEAYWAQFEAEVDKELERLFAEGVDEGETHE